MKKPKMKIVDERAEYGVYIWITDDNRKVMDDQGNYMLIQAKRGNLHAINKLGEAAKHYGIEGGRAVFVATRPISDEEYQEQLARMEAGLIPDPLDPGILRDELSVRR